MRLTLVELNLQRPKEIPLRNIRPWVIEHLKKHGDPLRWAITAIQASKANNCLKELKVEAVVITSESKSLDT